MNPKNSWDMCWTDNHLTPRSGLMACFGWRQSDQHKSLPQKQVVVIFDPSQDCRPVRVNYQVISYFKDTKTTKLESHGQ